MNFDSDAYYSETASTVEEAKKFVEAGFEYMCNIGDFKLFRKSKGVRKG